MSAIKGKLYYLMGASGSGKDSIFRYFREHFIGNCAKPVIVAHRYVTRPADATENSVSLSLDEFMLRKEKGLFALDWQANDLHYAIGFELDQWLAAGVSVLINGSRAYLPQAQSRYPQQLHSINVDVPEAVLSERLYQRDRESPEAIEARLTRHRDLQQSLTADSVIINNAALSDAAKSLQQIITHD